MSSRFFKKTFKVWVQSPCGGVGGERIPCHCVTFQKQPPSSPLKASVEAFKAPFQGLSPSAPPARGFKGLKGLKNFKGLKGA